MFEVFKADCVFYYAKVSKIDVIYFYVIDLCLPDEFLLVERQFEQALGLILIDELQLD